MSLQVLASAAVVLTVAVAMLVILAVHRRERRLLAALLERLDDMESRWAASPPRPVESAGGDPVASAEQTEGSMFSPSADVLAGMTSQVNRIVRSGGGMAESLADQAIYCVHRHIEDNVSPPTIAGELFVSLRTLERGLAVALDCTPSQLILAMKMREARRLLKTGEHSVGEVANRLGFANPFHFSRRFKSFYRVSPSELCRATRRLSSM